MSSENLTTINTWIAQEKPAFDNFNEFVATRLQDGWAGAVPQTLGQQIDEGSTEASVELPWGTYTAKVVKVGEGTNITPSFEPSKNFKKLLNDDGGPNRDRRMETFDAAFQKNFLDWVAYGQFGTPSEKDMPNIDKGMRLDQEEVEYFLNGYMQVLATIGRDHQRSGKEYELTVATDAGFDHGKFIFEYTDDEINVRFEPSKAFKQALKRDDIAGETLELQKAAYSQQHVITKAASYSTKLKKIKKLARGMDRDRDGFVKLNRHIA